MDPFGYFVSSLSILLQEAAVQANTGDLHQHFADLRETVQGFHTSPKISQSTISTSASSVVHVPPVVQCIHVAKNVCPRCFRKPFHVFISTVPLCSELSERPTCTDCYSLTFNVGVQNTSSLTDAFIHRSSMLIASAHGRLSRPSSARSNALPQPFTTKLASNLHCSEFRRYLFSVYLLI